MSVYVDAPVYRFRGMHMCHMLADSPDELHAMAARIGVARKHYQTFPRASFPHYDICKTKRALAVQLGALETDRHGIANVMKRLKPEIRKNPQPWALQTGATA